MNNITTEIQEAIARNLPHAVGEELRKRLEQADKDAATVKSLRDDVQLVRTGNADLTAKNAQLEARLAEHAALDKRETEVAERERKAQITELQVQLKAATENTQFARDVAMGLVRNVEYRNTVHETTTNKSHPVQGSGGTMGWVSNSSQPERTETTTTKSFA